MHGDGHRHVCPNCGQGVEHQRDILSNRELRGPRNITSSNIDRCFDDNGQRFLIIEEKQPGEAVPGGQRQMLNALSALPGVEVWGVRGTPDALSITRILPSSTEVMLSGANWDGYQKSVSNWFASQTPPTDTWALFEQIVSRPFTPPPDLPANIEWEPIDLAITALAQAISQEAS